MMIPFYLVILFSTLETLSNYHFPRSHVSTSVPHAIWLLFIDVSFSQPLPMSSRFHCTE